MINTERKRARSKLNIKTYHRIHQESTGRTKNNPETKDPDEKITKFLSSIPPLMNSFPLLETTVTFIFPNGKRPTSQNRIEGQNLLWKWIKNLFSSLIKIKLGRREGEQKVMVFETIWTVETFKAWIQKD